MQRAILHSTKAKTCRRGEHIIACFEKSTGLLKWRKSGVSAPLSEIDLFPFQMLDSSAEFRLNHSPKESGFRLICLFAFLACSQFCLDPANRNNSLEIQHRVSCYGSRAGPSIETN